MRTWVVSFFGALCIVLTVALPASAQTDGDHFESAMTAVEQERWDTALDELELAYRETPSPTVIYWRVVVLEKAGHAELALELLRQHREALASEPAAADLTVIEERLRAAVATDSPEPVESPTASRSAPDRPRRPVVGPLVLGVAGLAAIGAGVYGLAAANCDDVATTGTCTRTNPVVTGLYLTAGGLAIAGAFVWHFAGGNGEPATAVFRPIVGAGRLGAALQLFF